MIASLLLATHVPLRTVNGRVLIDDQTAAGIAQWCRHFEAVTYYGIAEDAGARHASSTTWVDLRDHPATANCTLAALPNAYTMGRMARTYGAVRALLGREIARHRHLCFTIGALVGDWPSIGAREAIRQQRAYAAWLDFCEPQVIRNRLAGAPLLRRLLGEAKLPAIERNIRHILRHSTVALLQGRDTFDIYAELAPDPHCTYDTHTRTCDRIASDALAGKIGRIRAGAPVNILYVGRAAPMKGPHDWLDTLDRLQAAGIAFRATWIGDGPELAAMRARVAGSALAPVVELPGFEGDRDILLARMRDSDLMLFCHKTPESPRCLIEALVSGCPIVGYESAYPRGLVAARGGGLFAPQDDPAALAGRIGALDRDREAFGRLIAEAAASGELYNEDDVYAHRAGLMKRADTAPQA